MWLGFSYTEVLDLPISELPDWLGVYDIYYNKQVLDQHYAGLISVIKDKDKAIQRLVDKINIAKGFNRHIPSDGAKQRTKQALMQMHKAK